jgi:hypothetical protein
VTEELERTTPTQTYKHIPKSIATITAEHNTLLQDLGFPINQSTTIHSLFHGNYQAHKNGFRFIAGDSKAPLKPLSKGINTALKALKPYLSTLWTKAFDNHTLYIIPTSNLIASKSSDLSDLVDDINVNLPHDANIPVSTHDFSTLYTKLELPVLQTRLKTLIDTLFKHIADYKSTSVNTLRLHINTITDTSEWTTNKKQKLKDHEFLPDAATLSLWITTLTNNTVVMHNNKAYLQIIGIPMGTNCAVFLANFILFTYEYDYLLHCLSTKFYTRIEELRYQKRFLDDILSLNNPHYNNYNYEIYPEHMLTSKQKKGTYLQIGTYSKSEKLCILRYLYVHVLSIVAGLSRNSMKIA